MAGIIRVAAASRSVAVAGAIAGALREEQCAIVQAIGAGAVNQAIKATAIARSYLMEEGLDLFVVPDFTTIEIADGQRTATRLTVYTQHHPDAPDGSLGSL